ncbi:hypothetical protein ECEC1737_0875, partial [Escherichia coli EC1737]
AEDEDASSDCFAAAALSAACRADSNASPAEVSAFAALASALLDDMPAFLADVSASPAFFFASSA